MKDYLFIYIVVGFLVVLVHLIRLLQALILSQSLYLDLFLSVFESNDISKFDDTG